MSLEGAKPNISRLYCKLKCDRNSCKGPGPGGYSGAHALQAGEDRRGHARREEVRGRGFHSSTSHLNPSPFVTKFHKNDPTCPTLKKCSRQPGKWKSVSPCFGGNEASDRDRVTAAGSAAGGGVDNKHSTDAESPPSFPPPLRVRMRVNPEGKPCSDLGRVLPCSQ